MISRSWLVWASALGLLASVGQGNSGADEGSPGAHHTFRYNYESGGPCRLGAMIFSPDAATLVVSVESRGVHFIDTRKGETTGAFKSLSPFQLGYSHDRSRLLMVADGKRLLLEVDTGLPLKADTNRVPGYFGIQYESREGKLLIKSMTPGGPAAASGELKVGDEVTGFCDGKVGSFDSLIGRSTSTAVGSMQGMAGTYARLQAVPAGSMTPKEVTLRRMAARIDGQNMTFLPEKPLAIRDNLIWGGTRENRHMIVNTTTGEVVSILEPSRVELFGRQALSPDFGRFAIVSNLRDDRRKFGVEIFDVKTQQTASFVPYPRRWAHDIRFSPDGVQILIGGWDTIDRLELATGKFLKPLTLGWKPPREKKEEEADVSLANPAFQAAKDYLDFREEVDRKLSPKQLVSRLAPSTRGLVATGDPYGQVKVWSLADGHLVHAFPSPVEEEVEGVEFSRNGQFLAYYVKGVLHLVDVPALTPEGRTGPGDAKAPDADGLPSLEEALPPIRKP